jgi:IS1 family transposase
MLDWLYIRLDNKLMNKKSTKERAQILRCLVEGNSIRLTVRLTGASKNTVTKLLVEVGEACAAYHNQTLVHLPCKRIQVDEIWSFVYSKQKNTPEEMLGEAGDVWTWTAICADTKLVASWYVGGRDAGTGFDFMNDLASRMSERIQLTSDGHKAYLKAVEGVFGNDIDYGWLVKLYGDAPEGQRRYSPCQCIGAKQHAVFGDPDEKHISTSYVERQNLTMRMSMRRFTRLTNAFSKKVENHVRAIALHFMHYNFCRVHSSIKTTPAVAAGVADKIWSLEDVVEMTDAYWEDKKLLNSN